MKKSSKIPLHQAVIAALFVLTIAAGVVLFLALPKRTFSPEENRNLQQLPTFSLSTVLSGDFSKKFESYLSDQFPARDFWIGVKAASERLTLKQENNGVYFGKDGWLFEKLIAPEREHFEKNLQGFTLLARTTGKQVALLPVPSSAQELPQYLPAFAPEYDQRLMLQELQESLADANVTVVDAFDALKNQDSYYFKTDHHWTVRGAYVGYRLLCEALGVDALPQDSFEYELGSSDFHGTLYSSAGDKLIPPDIVELPISKEFPEISMTVMDDGTERNSIFWRERLEEKDKYTVYNGGNHALVVTHNPGGNGRRLLLLKDSYAHAMLPYLAATYSEVHMMDLRYYSSGMYEYIEEQGIDDIAALYSMKLLGESSLYPLHFLPKN